MHDSLQKFSGEGTSVCRCLHKWIWLVGAAGSEISADRSLTGQRSVARFGNANEHSDWETAHHVFTYANAVDQMLRRIGANEDAAQAPVRGVLHGAMALYLTRYLNVPPLASRGTTESSSMTCPRMWRKYAPPYSMLSTGSDRLILRQG
jgi:hypothetical protein